jgi:uncharacterized protein
MISANHDDPTIAACWDADPLELPRVGTPPHPDHLGTEAAKEMLRFKPQI